MSKPVYQKAIEHGILFVGGILSVGGILGSIVDARELIDIKVAVTTTAILLIAVAIYVYKKSRRSINWQADDGSQIRIKKLNNSLFVSIAGGIFLVWLSPIYSALTIQPESGKSEHRSSIHDAVTGDTASANRTSTIDSLVKKAREYVNNGELQRADSAYTKVFEIDNQAKGYLIEAADFFSFHGGYVKAGALMKQLIVLTFRPDEKAYLYFVLGQNFLSVLKFDSAIHYLQKSSKEFYELQLISGLYLPKYALVKAAEVRIKILTERYPPQDHALDSIADLISDCDNKVCKAILFSILLNKINTGSSADPNSTSAKSAVETNAELNSALEVGRQLMQFNKKYELPVQFMELMKTGNALAQSNAVDFSDIDEEITQSLQACRKYSTERIGTPEKYFLKDFPDIFRDTELTTEVLVGYNVLLLKTCTHLTLLLARYSDAELSLYPDRKKEVLRIAYSLDRMYHQTFLKYPLIYGSTPSANMMNLSEIAFTFGEYALAERILIDLTTALKKIKKIALINQKLLCQAKHLLIMVRFNKLEQTNLNDTSEISSLIRMTEEVEGLYRSFLKYDKLERNKKEAYANLELLDSLKSDISNYGIKMRRKSN